MREKEGKRDEEFMHAHTCLKCYGERCRGIRLKKNISICMVHQILYDGVLLAGRILF